MKRAIPVVMVAAIVLGSVGRAAGYLITISDSGRGWISSLDGPNGNDPGNNYLAGKYHDALYRNHFDFQVPLLAGTLESAVLQLDNPSHGGPTHVFTAYGLGAYGTYGFGDIGAGAQYGSVSLSSYGPAAISLNEAALSAIEAAQGGLFSLGGVDSGERGYRQSDFDFGFSYFISQTTLTLNVAPSIPEPSTLVMFAVLGTAGLIAACRRRRAA